MIDNLTLRANQQVESGVPVFDPPAILLQAMHVPTRSRLAPPLSLDDVGLNFHLRDFEPGDLVMNPRDIAHYLTIKEISRSHSRATLLVDSDKILKLYSYLVDVSVIVDNMNLARTKVPVPNIYSYGHSGNCAYILMEMVKAAWPLDACVRVNQCPVPSAVTTRIKQIVADLASLGLSHNDLHPRNVMVDRRWKVRSIIDWDDCARLEVGGEYAR